MARVVSIDSGCYRVPLPVVLSDSTHGEMSDFELVTARVRDADGMEGLGYTYSVHAGGLAIHALIERYLAPRLLGEDAARIEMLWQAMSRLLHWGRGGYAAMAISALDIALWDLAAKRAKAPLWRHLGGYDPAVPCYAGGIDLQFPIERLLTQSDAFQAQGFRAIKMKVGRGQLAEDVERVRAMRRHLGEAFPLMADANMRWSVDEAVRAARALADTGLVWLEEPTAPEDVEGQARILREGGLPIAAGENLRSLHEFKQLIAAAAVSFPEPDVANCGGVTVFMKICRLAEAYHLPVTSHGVHDLTVHLLAAAPNRAYLEVHGFGLERFMAEPMRIVEGCAIAPERPGHGVVLDFERLEAHRAS